MRVVVVRVPLVMVACLLWLAGCTTAQLGGPTASSEADGQAAVASADPAGPGAATDGSAPPAEGATAAGPSVLGSDPNDHLSLGKKQFRAANYGLAEQHFRKAVEAHPKDAEAWIGLAAANDRLRRFDLADRAYKEAIAILGPTPEILNNQGFSYLLRGNYAKARKTLREAQTLDPRNPYILNNLNLLERTARKGKSVQ